MKKITSLLAVLCIALTAHAQQYFTITPQGIVSTADPAKKYVVIEFPGLTQEQLYDYVDQYIRTAYPLSESIEPSPKERISFTTNTTVEALAGLFKRPYNLNYTLTVQFKEGRIRVNAPVINDIVSDALGETTRLYLTVPDKDKDGYFLFSKDGKVKNAPGKENLEAFFTHTVTGLMTTIKNTQETDDDDDW